MTDADAKALVAIAVIVSLLGFVCLVTGWLKFAMNNKLPPQGGAWIFAALLCFALLQLLGFQ